MSVCPLSTKSPELERKGLPGPRLCFFSCANHNLFFLKYPIAWTLVIEERMS